MEKLTSRKYFLKISTFLNNENLIQTNISQGIIYRTDKKEEP